MSRYEFQSANADFVTDYLVVGGDLDHRLEDAVMQATELVERAGVTHVLDVRLEAQEDLWAFVGDTTYFWDGIDDAGQIVPAEWFERVTGWANRAIDAQGTVFAHCHMGINRGPSAGFAILLRRGWDPVDAIAAIRTARPQAFVAYAEDALEWSFDRNAMSPAERQRIRAELLAWRNAHPMDVRRAIRRGGRRTGGWAA
jgi:dual specificity phosphatase 3